MFLFYVFWEVMLLPMYFLIGIWGGPRKEYAAIKFFLYTLVGSVLMLLAVIAIYYSSHSAQMADGTMSSGHTFKPAGAGTTRPRRRVRAHRAHFGFCLHQDHLRGALHWVRHQDPDVPFSHPGCPMHTWKRPRRFP